MKEIVFVGTGGFIGAALRYITSTWFSQFSRFGFPLGTFAVNFFGCILLGAFVGLGLEKNSNIPIKEFTVIGVLGGFTTFSTFGLESIELLKTGQFKMTAIYVFGSVVLGIMGIALGIMVSK
ncbi:MAG: fluoride efflux transporter CrcB [Candidatus Marinimicrobia bacterium]|nr:fluoride efflux transporter CrcB [Candidatus Neomarinimicrobiota bacterium]